MTSWAELVSRGCQDLTCLALALLQKVHSFEVLVSRRAEGKEGRAFVGNMTDEASVDLASKVASESFVFMVSDDDNLHLACGVIVRVNPMSSGPRSCRMRQ